MHAHVNTVIAPSGQEVDISLICYADDTQKCLARPADETRELATDASKSSRDLDQALLPRNLKQNGAKRVIAPHVIGSERLRILSEYISANPFGGIV